MTSLRIAFTLNNSAVVQLHDGVFTGPAAEVALHITEALGDVTLKGYPDARSILQDVSSGWDMAFLAADPKRAHLMRFSTPYLQVRATLLLHEDNPATTFAEFLATGQPILSVAGAAYHGHLAGLVPEICLIAAESAADARQRFADGDAPALAGLRATFADRPFPETRMLQDDFAFISQAVALAPEPASLLDTVEIAIHKEGLS